MIPTLFSPLLHTGAVAVSQAKGVNPSYDFWVAVSCRTHCPSQKNVASTNYVLKLKCGVASSLSGGLVNCVVFRFPIGCQHQWTPCFVKCLSVFKPVSACFCLCFAKWLVLLSLRHQPLGSVLLVRD